LKLLHVSVHLEQVSGFPVAVIKEWHALRQMPGEADPAEALALLNETKKFLLGGKLICKDADLAAWGGNG
jgi:NitT/TauT family transport system substrate-binding protein/sulfonate transport system substrate-binding protein